MPQKFGFLTDDEADALTDLMAFGLDTGETIDGVEVAAFVPLSVQQAARFMGVRVKRARASFTDSALRKMYAAKLEALRDGERARNIATAIEIRDHIGEGLAADQTVRLKAIATLEGKSDARPSVAVQINNSVQGQTITPGYVIQLQAAPAQSVIASSDQNPLSLPKSSPFVIEGSKVEGTE